MSWGVLCIFCSHWTFAVNGDGRLACIYGRWGLHIEPFTQRCIVQTYATNSTIYHQCGSICLMNFLEPCVPLSSTIIAVLVLCQGITPRFTATFGSQVHILHTTQYKFESMSHLRL